MKRKFMKDEFTIGDAYYDIGEILAEPDEAPTYRYI